MLNERDFSQSTHFPLFCSHQGPGKATTLPTLHISEASGHPSLIVGVTFPV